MTTDSTSIQEGGYEEKLPHEHYVANILLKAACEYKKMEIATIHTVAKEARPYWLHLAHSLAPFVKKEGV